MLATFGSLSIYLVNFISRKYAIIYAVFFSIFMSRVFSFSLSEGGMPITYTRLVYPLILIIILASLILQMRNLWSKQFGIGLMHFFLVVLSTILAGRISALPYVFDWFLSTYIFFLAGIIFIWSGGKSKTVNHFTLVSIVTLFVLAILEILAERPLIATMLNTGFIEASHTSEKVLQGRIRDGVLRLQLFADNPLRLAQYANILYACVISNFTSRDRAVKLVLAVMLFTIVCLTQSRSGIALFLIITSLAIFPTIPRVRQRVFAKSVHVLILVGVGLIVFYASPAVFSTMNTYSDVKMHELSSADRSSIERSAQVLWTIDAFLKSPIYGLGFLPNAGENLQDLNSLDSYILRTLLEGGMLGIILFGAFILWNVRSAMKNISHTSALGYLSISVALVWGAAFEYTSETFMLSFFFLGYYTAKMKCDNLR